MERVLHHFYELTKIPRPSGKEERVVEYIENFAKKNNLEYFKDNYNNIIVKKFSCNKQPIILQAHTDMVCVKSDKHNFDFLKDEIKTIIEGDFLTAQNTSLGADNGVGVSMILSILEENFDMNVECVFTSEEETTMNGAKNLDASLLKSKRLISLDGSDEGVIDVSSAGMANILLSSNFEFKTKNINKFFTLSLSGLIGGHSGQDINKNRGNAHQIALGLLSEIEDVEIIDINAKTKANVIPIECEICFTSKADEKLLLEHFSNKIEQIKNQIDAPNIKYSITSSVKHVPIEVEVLKNSKEFLEFVLNLPLGVLEEGSYGVVVSTNLYEINLKENFVALSLRSSDKKLEKFYFDQIKKHCENYEFVFKLENKTPFFEFKEKSELREILCFTYEKLFDKKPILQRVHAGLEGGVFAEKIPDIDMVVIGPTIFNMHSVGERVSLSSINNTYNWLKTALQYIFK